MNPTPKNKPASQSSVAAWLRADDVLELRAMYPQARDEELAELMVYLNAYPEGMAYLRRNPNMFEYALMGTKTKCIGFIAAFILSIPKPEPQTDTPPDVNSSARDNSGSAGR